MSESAAKTAKHIVLRLREAGFQAYFVGGCVRDMLMGRQAKDIDIATDARPGDVGRLFPRTLAVGAHFGVMIVLVGGEQFEVATFRADGEYLDGRRPAEVHFCDAVHDVLRRDFTINGMLYDPVSDAVIDHVGGQADIAAKVLRCIGDPVERFEEDRLRVLRAVRFACRLGFDIDPATLKAAKQVAPNIGTVSAERIREELVRILTEGGPSRGIRLLMDIAALAVILPEVAAMDGVPQPPEFHPEGDVLTHTLLCLDALDAPSAELAMAVLLHDVGKPATMEQKERLRFHGHDEKGGAIAREMCRRLKFSNAQTEKIAWLVENHMRFMNVLDMRQGKLKRLLREEHFADLLELHRVDCVASHGDLAKWRFCKEKLAELSEEDLRPEPLIDGRRLIEMGYTPGRIFKDILSAVESAQLEGEIATPEEAEALVRRDYPAV